MLGNMSEYMYVLKCHGAEHSKYSNLNLAIVLSRSVFCFYRSISMFFLPLKSFRRSVFLSFTCLPFLSFYLVYPQITFFSHRLNLVKRNLDNLGQNIVHLFAIFELEESWTTYCALVCYFRT